MLVTIPDRAVVHGHVSPGFESVHAAFVDNFVHRGEVQFSFGFMKPSAVWPFGSSDATFGSPGAGGSLGFADPQLGIGYAYVTNRMGTTLTGDPRDVALRNALDEARI